MSTALFKHRVSYSRKKLPRLLQQLNWIQLRKQLYNPDHHEQFFAAIEDSKHPYYPTMVDIHNKSYSHLTLDTHSMLRDLPYGQNFHHSLVLSHQPSISYVGEVTRLDFRRFPLQVAIRAYEQGRITNKVPYYLAQYLMLSSVGGYGISQGECTSNVFLALCHHLSYELYETLHTLMEDEYERITDFLSTKGEVLRSHVADSFLRIYVAGDSSPWQHELEPLLADHYDHAVHAHLGLLSHREGCITVDTDGKIRDTVRSGMFATDTHTTFFSDIVAYMRKRKLAALMGEGIEPVRTVLELEMSGLKA